MNLNSDIQSMTVICFLFVILKINIRINKLPVIRNNGFGFSIDSGIAGIGTVVLEYITNNMDLPVTTTPSNSEYNSIYASVEVSTDIPSTTDKSDTNDSYLMIYFPILFLIMLIRKLTRLRRKS